jgi:transcriptional regulator with XRE-family HTH domain
MLLGGRHRQIREAKGFTQRDIKARSGLARCYLSRVENCHTIPALDTLEKWTNALGIPLYQLFFEHTSDFAPSANQILLPTETNCNSVIL